MTTVVRSPWRSTVSTLSRLIKIGVGDLSGPACLPQSDQLGIAFLPLFQSLGTVSVSRSSFGQLVAVGMSGAGVWIAKRGLQNIYGSVVRRLRELNHTLLGKTVIEFAPPGLGMQRDR